MHKKRVRDVAAAAEDLASPQPWNGPVEVPLATSRHPLFKPLHLFLSLWILSSGMRP